MISLSSLNTIQGYTQNMKAKSLWEQRKKNGYYDKLAETDRTRASFQEQADKMHGQQDVDLEAITNKLQQGQALTPQEKEKLRAERPELYKKVRQMEAEQKQLEEELRRCKTKDDVRRLKLQKMQSSLQSLNAVANNPNIPESAKLAVAQEINMKVRGFNRVTEQFVQSGAYAKLPTQQEVDQARQEEAELQRPKPQEPEAPPEAAPETPERTPEASPETPEETPETAEAALETPEAAPQQVPDASQPQPEKRVVSEQSRRVLASYRRASSYRPKTVPLELVPQQTQPEKP